MNKKWIALAGGTAAVAGAVYGLLSLQQQSATEQAALDCPPGYTARDPVAYAREINPNLTPEFADKIRAQYGEEACGYNRLPESFAEIDRWSERPGAMAGVPEGAARAALAHKRSMEPLRQKVANANGVWENYGKGPQISLQEFVDGSRDGIPSVAGRVDDFAYDEANKRLFAAVGTGGIWMTEAVGGDVGTLAESWVDLGKNMPTTIASAVAWTTWQGGRLLVLTGEHVQGGNTYVGLGAFWSDDLGATWNQAEGVPDGAGASTLAVDQAHPNIVYAATHKGLYR
ncbi:MAG: hypothetical protein ACPHCJ_00915, partial [Oceanococcaceae bacterium]